jgi:hypothetical protein
VGLQTLQTPVIHIMCVLFALCSKVHSAKDLIGSNVCCKYSIILRCGIPLCVNYSIQGEIGRASCRERVSVRV